MFTTPAIYPFQATSSVVEATNRIREEANNSKLTLLFLLDKSGSMQVIREDMLGSLNTFLNDQKKIAENSPQVSLILFNNKIEVKYINQPIMDIPDLSLSDYVPSGSTSLYDTVGSTLDLYKDYKKVIVIIITDGQDNSSKEYNQYSIKKKIEQKSSDSGWSFIYLSNNLDNSQQGDQMGLYSSNQTANCTIDKSNFSTFISRDISNAVKKYRQTSTSISSQLTQQL